jgi:hypothetical protein
MTVGNRLDNQMENFSDEAQSRVKAGVSLILDLEKKRAQFESHLLDGKRLNAFQLITEIDELKHLLKSLF